MNALILWDVLLLVGLMVIGVPVPLCFAAAVILLVTVGDLASATFLVPVGMSQLSSLTLLAIPLFIMAGDIMTRAGLAERLIAVGEALAGRMRGGLSLVVIVTTAVFGAISGMATSAVATIGSIMIPRMVERGYDRGYATSLIACSSVLALLIPPSSSMILYGWVTDTNIIAVFLAPVFPAIILMALFLLVNRLLTRKMPIIASEAEIEDIKYHRHLWQVGRKSGLALLMPVIILGCIYGGVTTPTEAAAIAVVYAVPVGFFAYRELDIKSLYESLWQTAKITGAVMFLVFFSAMLARLYTMENVPQGIMSALFSISDNPMVLLLLINLFLIFVGMLMDDISGVLLASPLLLPVMTELGVHPVQFGAIIAVNLGMGLVTPPTAPILYFAGLIGKAKTKTILKPTLYFVFLAYLPVVLLTTFIPALSLWLPRLLLGIK